MKLLFSLLLVTLWYSDQAFANGDRVKFNLRTTVWIVNGDVHPTFQNQVVEGVMEKTATGTDMAQIDIPLTLVRPDTKTKFESKFKLIVLRTRNKQESADPECLVSSWIEGVSSDLPRSGSNLVTLRSLDAFFGNRNVTHLKRQTDSKGKRLKIQVTSEISEFTVVR